MDKAELDAITERIIGAAHKVSNTLRHLRICGKSLRECSMSNSSPSPFPNLENNVLEVCETINRLSKTSYSSPFISGEKFYV